MKTFFYFFLFIAPFLIQTSCSGNQCAANTNYIVDEDSDCVADGSDNCVGWYNPDQFDGDEDGVGAACDSNDQDKTTVGISLIDDETLNLFGHFKILNFSNLSSRAQGEYTLTKSTCPIQTETLTIENETSFNIVSDSNQVLNCLVIYKPDQHTVYCINSDKTCQAVYEKFF